MSFPTAEGCHPILRRVGFKRIKNLLESDLNGKVILDLGCGYGDVSSRFTNTNKVIGVDTSEGALEKSREAGLTPLKYDLNFHHLPFRKESVDVVLLIHTLEHLLKVESLLNEIYEVLKESGVLILSVPNHFDLIQRFRILFGKGIVRWTDKKLCNVYAADYFHVKFFTLSELEELFRKTGFYVDTIQYTWLRFGFGRLNSEKLPNFFIKFALRNFPSLLSFEFTFKLTKKKSEEKTLIVKTDEYIKVP